MIRRLVLSTVCVLYLGTAALFGQDKASDETIRIDTKLVSVPTIVSDHNGRYIPNLRQSDFKVFQDGTEQKVEFFAATEEPISVALLIDTSQSTRPVLDDIKESAKAFLKLLKPQDKAMVVAFDYDIHALSPLTSNQEQLKDAIKHAEIPPRGMVGTLLRDAVLDTVANTFRNLTGRKAIILLTDGKDSGSRTRIPDLLYRLQETDTLIYSVMFKTAGIPPQVQDRIARVMNRRGGMGGGFPPMQLPPPISPQRQGRMEANNERAAEFLQELSDVTAGRFYSSKDGKLKETFASIVEELRFQYRLGFYPPEEPTQAGALHEIKVKVARPDSVVRSRSSYRSMR